MPPLTLPDFTMSERATELAASPEGAEPESLAAFEDGYRAGWEDAATAQADAKAAREAEVARHLQGLTFGIDEARNHVLQALEPLLMQIVGTVLPQIARVTLAPIVAEALMPLAEQAAAAPVQLRTTAAARAMVEDHLSRIPGLSFEVAEDPSLTDGCVMIATGPVELRVDLDTATAGITKAVQAYFQIEAEERQDAG